MKLRKALIMSCVLPVLMSCNTNNIAGTYGFQMGKDTGTHFGLYLNLTNNSYIVLDSQQHEYKQFTLELSVSIGTGTEGGASIQDILEYIADDNGKATLPGYYQLTSEKNSKAESRMIVGFDYPTILNRVASYIKKSSGEEIDIGEASQEFAELNNVGLIQSLLYVTYKSDMVYLYIPVSVEDALFQVYWYGYDLVMVDNPDPDALFPKSLEIVEVEKHAFGTHPKKEDIDAINASGYADNHTYLPEESREYRDYNSVRTGLAKR